MKIRVSSCRSSLASRVGLVAAATVLAGTLAAACSTSPAPPTDLRLDVSQQVSLYGVPLSIRVTGLMAGDQVTVRLATRTQAWSSRATFDAPGSVLNLATAAPVSGSYHGVDEMGLFESLSSAKPGSELNPGSALVLSLSATVLGRTTRTTLTRQVVGPGVNCAQLSVARQGFYGLYCAPAPFAGRRPAVLVFGGSEGGLATAPEAELLASSGYPALALAYFDEPGLPSALDRIPLEYFVRAIRWLDGRPGVNAGQLAVFGDSRGSEAALLLGAYFPRLVHAVIAGSPSSVINSAVSLTHRVPLTDPAWTLDGKPLPAAIPYGAVPPSNPDSIIPVQLIKGPVLLLVGADDLLWPSQQYAREIMARLDTYHDRYLHQELLAPGAGHLTGSAFPYEVGPTTYSTAAGVLDLGGTSFADSVAETSAWQDILALLRRLAGSSP